MMSRIVLFLVSMVCGIVFAGNSKQVEQCFSHDYLEEAYDASAKAYTHENRDRYYPMDAFAEINKKIPKNSNILDAGCGSGLPVAEYFSERGHRVTGVDISGKMLKLARKNAPKAKKFIKKSIFDLDFPNDTFDLITSVYTIFHIDREKHEGIFRNFYRMLKEGGLAYFTLCNGSRTDGKPEFHGTMEFDGKKLPYSHYSKERYREMLEQIGFKNISMEDMLLGGYTFTWVTAYK
jgi:ubiquinone/menaquinone biosynthesis C-methylase UbiE